MSFSKGSKWLIERERDDKSAVPDQTIEVIDVAADGPGFTAKYVGIDDSSVFTGQIWAREMQIINLMQHHQPTGYVAFHTALPKSNAGNDPTYYGGRWYDVTGNHGAFRLTKKA